jgi:chemotaxis-related protein WspD
MAAPSGAPELALDDCWNRIGVQGDRTCPELLAHVHCRNCPVYAAAARAALDRGLPAGYAASWGRRFADVPAARASEPSSWFIFRVGVEWLGVATLLVDEVAPVPPVRSLPHRRGGALLGLVNVRGELVVCVSLPRVLGAGAGAAAAASDGRARPRLVVLRRGQSRFATPVDEVLGARLVESSELVAAPATLVEARGAFTRRVLPWDGRAVGCLDEDALWRALERSTA